MGQIQSLEELLNFLYRRRMIILVVAVLGALLSAIYAKSRPDTFETAAVIQIQSAAVQGTDEQRSSAAAVTLQSIEQQLTTRENLAAAIERHGLYADLPLSIDKKIDMLRASISFQGVDSAAGQPFGEARNLSAILVFARMGEAELAARVANDFAQGILDMSAAGQRAKAEQNVAFFRQEVDRIGQEMAAVEAETARYKNENAGILPEMRVALGDEMVNLDTDLRQLRQDRVALEGQAAQINAKETRRETDRRALDDITAQLSVIDSQIASAEARQTALEAELATSPEVERVLAGYDRRLDQLRAQHDAATGRMVQAETDARLAELQQTERFTLLERAIIPEGPMGGGNKKLAIAGAMASLLAGLAIAFMLDLMNPVVRTAAQMERQLDLRPVVSIPEVVAPKNAGAGKGLVKLLDDPTKPLLGLPRYAVIAGASTLALLLLASLV
ncbi:MAG: hypothetical protein E6Q73_00385 [Pseudorhodobacter sp.]|nr:MAG: hypothetical protein E6Q73_00385 [Pseudorhodobacter sp.]